MFYIKSVYLNPHILLDLASCVSVPLKFDANIVSGEVGHYGRILVNVGLAFKFPYFVLLQQLSRSIAVHLHYENLPDFCTICHSIGHALLNCRRLDLYGSRASKVERVL